MTQKAVPGQRRRPTIEAVEPWIDAAQAWGLRRTRARLLAAGLSPAQASGVAFWLSDLAHGEEHVESPTRMRYSRLLGALGPPDSLGGVRPTPPYVRRSAAA